MSNSQLDEIISKGKVDQATAMVVFAVELKNQGEKVDKLTDSINKDNERYVPREDYNKLEARVARLENGALKVLVTVFLFVLAAAVGLTIYAGRQ